MKNQCELDIYLMDLEPNINRQQMVKKQPIQQKNQEDNNKDNHNHSYSQSMDRNQNELSHQLSHNQWWRYTNYNIENNIYRLVEDDVSHQDSNNYIEVQGNIINQQEEEHSKFPHSDDTVNNWSDGDFRSPKTTNNTHPNEIVNTNKINSNINNNTKNRKSLFPINTNSSNAHVINSSSYQTLLNPSHSNSILSSLKTLAHHLHSIELPTLLSYLPFLHRKPTLYSEYKHSSLAILNNSIDLEQAIIKALEYNIPLMQIVMVGKPSTQNTTNHSEKSSANINNSNSNSNAATRNDKKRVKQQECSQDSLIIGRKILNNFQISHFINQNFVLYGDWSYEKYQHPFFNNNNIIKPNIHSSIEEKRQYNYCDKIQNKCGKILFRKGSLVFGEIDIGGLQTLKEDELVEKLEQMRNRYYSMRQQQRYHNKMPGRTKQIAKSNTVNKSNNNINSKSSNISKSNISKSNNNNNSPHKISNVTPSLQKPLTSSQRLKQIQQQILKQYFEQRQLEEIENIQSSEHYDRQIKVRIHEDSEQPSQQIQFQIKSYDKQQQFQQQHQQQSKQLAKPIQQQELV